MAFEIVGCVLGLRGVLVMLLVLFSQYTSNLCDARAGEFMDDAGGAARCVGRLTTVVQRGLTLTMSDESNVFRQRVPEALDTIIGHIGELRVVFGDAGAATMTAVEDDLRQALAARDGNDHPRAIGLIARAMERLSKLVATLDPEAAVAMGKLIERFRSAMLAGREGDARHTADVMREMSGARIVKKGR
jgi:hypothetical protein